jgi:predicted nucleic acid-binding protein
VADLETRVALVELKLDGLLELVNGGAAVRYEDSVRGRLHKVLQAQTNEAAVAEAIRELRRSQRRRWSSGQKVLAAACGIAVAAAPYVAIALHAG